MRETWVPFFQDIRNSSMWAYDAETFKVWMTLLTMVDPEGYICAAIPGIAVAANIPVAKVRKAIALFEAPDPDSRSASHEGRRLEKVDRGWLMLNFADMRKRAAHEAEKARKRRWARENRTPANDTGFVENVDAPGTGGVETVDASKSKSKSSPPQKEGIPPTPQEVPEEQPRGVVWRTLEGWLEPEGLATEALAAGVPAEVYRSRLKELRNGPIGGTRGVLDRTDYVRNQFGKWRTWAETDRARALAAQGAPRAGGGRLPVLLEPSAKHEAFAARHGLDVQAIVRGIIEEDIPDKLGMGRAREVIAERLSKAAREKGRASA